MARSFHQYSPATQVMVCAVLAIGVLGAAWSALIEPEQVELAARRTRLAGIHTGVEQATAIARRLDAVRHEIASLEAALLQPTAVLSDESNGQGVLRSLHRLASESSLSISNFTPKPGPEREENFDWPIELGLEGGYHDLARFFDRVASEPRVISVSNLQFRANTPGGTRRGPVQVTCVATPMTIGARMDVPPTGEYDDGGRRDPFASPLAEKARPAAPESADARPRGLIGVAVMDVAVRGIISSGQQWLAIIAVPDGATYLAHPEDRLHDAVVRRIDRDGVVFLARGRELRITFRPNPGEGR